MRDLGIKFALRPIGLRVDRTPDQRKRAYINLLNRARPWGTVDLVCGESLPPIFSDRDVHVMDAFQRAFDRNVTIRLIRGPVRLEDQIKLEEYNFKVSPGQLEILDFPKDITEGRPQRHFGAVDKTHVRVEGSPRIRSKNHLCLYQDECRTPSGGPPRRVLSDS